MNLQEVGKLVAVIGDEVSEVRCCPVRVNEIVPHDGRDVIDLFFSSNADFVGSRLSACIYSLLFTRCIHIWCW